MPFESNADLPPRIRNAMPAEAQSIFRRAFNASEGNGSDEGRAFVAGFSAVSSAGFSRGEGGKYSKRRISKRWQLTVFAKSESAKRVFYAWASVVEKDGVEVIDHDGHSWSPEEMEATAWNFAADVRQHGVNHESLEGSELVANIPFTHDLQKALGIDLGMVGWLTGWRVKSDALWKRIESGDLPMLSIGGSGFLDEVAA